MIVQENHQRIAVVYVQSNDQVTNRVVEVFVAQFTQSATGSTEEPVVVASVRHFFSHSLSVLSGLVTDSHNGKPH